MRLRKRRRKSLLYDRHSPPLTNKQLNVNIPQHEYYSNFKLVTYSNLGDLTKLSKSEKQNNRLKTKNFLIRLIHLTIYISTLFIIYHIEHSSNNPFHQSFIKLIDCNRVVNRLQLQSQNFFQSSLPQLQATFMSHNLPRNSLPEIIVQQGGIIKDKNVTLLKHYSPILFTKDIVIKKDAKLTIEPGTEIVFEKKKGIVVYGILEILGNPDDRVKLSLLKSQNSATINFRSQNNNPIFQQQVRLVDGDSPNEGRVQIKFNNRWHSLCTNSKNLTSIDINVLCRQAGYLDGSWYKWFSQRNDTKFQIMSKSFHCSGSETSLVQCRRWNRVRIGGGICDNHSDIGIRCSKTLALGPANYDFWKGIEFINSETTHEYVLDGQMKQKISRSNLKYMTISEAGMNEVGNATGAIRVLGQPPRMSDIEIKDSIYGIVIEDVDDAIKMSNIRLMHNMGNPLFINTSYGRISLDNMQVENNGGDGIRVARHEKVIVGSHDFCKFANLGPSQLFPVVLSHEQSFFTSGRDCCQEFLSSNQLTVHFPVLRSTPNNLLPESDNNRRVSVPPGVNIGKDASLVIYDDYRDEYPFRLRIQNGTRAQSIVSKSGRLKICYEPATYRTVLFTIEVVANVDDEWSGIVNDVEISNSLIRANQGRGIWVENQRSGLKVLNTTVLDNNYVAGIHVENGTGQVIIQASTISNNLGHGIYINLGGGYYHIDNSSVTDNFYKGIYVTYDKRPELTPFNHTFHLGYSLIARNRENGLFLGNVCRSDAFWNVSMNSFVKNGEDAVVFQSCLPIPETVSKFNTLTSRLNLSDSELQFRNNYQELLITHNIFSANLRRAIHMAPVFFVKSFIRHNLFKDHPLAVIYISNQRLPSVLQLLDNQILLAPVSIRIASNRFYTNKGRYVVNIGLQEDNPRQSLMFTKNTLESNHISEPYSDLRPRSRVSAVLVVSSSNTKVIRNRFENPMSLFEMGCHLEAHAKSINATTNFWGKDLDTVSIYKRIFDRKNRYNLAQIEFLQYLLSPDDLEYASDLSFDRERDKIITFRNGTRLGGEVKGYEELPPDTYTVQDDIYVRSKAHLIIKPGTVLKFHDGVGLMVQGRLDALGQTSSQIVFTSAISANRTPQRTQFTTTPAPVANPWISHQSSERDQFDEESAHSDNLLRARNNYTSDRIKKRQVGSTSQNVRLSHTTMGRLEVQVDGNWGSVCDYNFDIDDAAVVCQQLGMILNKDDWLLEKFQYASNDHQQISMMSTNVLMTNVQCDPSLDTDITSCKAEINSRGDFDGLCNSEVGIRCFPPSWSGIRLGMGAEISTLEHVTIQRAGMFDYAVYTLKPALQIDFNRHWISFLTIKSNSDSGLGIMWNDVIGRHFFELSVTGSKFMNNERHGIELRSRGLTIKNCSLSSNRQSGLEYNPSFSQEELHDFLSWLYTAKNYDNIVKLSLPLQERYFSVQSSEESYKFFVIQKNPLPDLVETFTISTDPGHMLSIQVLNPIHPESTESLNMSIGLNPESPIWDFRVNMTSFPMISPGYKFHFNYSTGKKPRGNIAFYIRSRYNNRDLKLLTKFIPAHLVMPKFEQTAENINSKVINSLIITNSNITKNGIGLKFSHPSYSYGIDNSYNLRYSNETTNITQNVLDSNYFSAIFVGADDINPNPDFMYRTTSSSEIHYIVARNRIRRNRDGLRQFSKDIRYSFNVFHWTIEDTTFDYNRGGGLNILLPFYWQYDVNRSHSVEIRNNDFSRNSNFEISIDGHFSVLNLTDNIIKENRCRNKLISFSGMEKNMLIRHNTIEFNICGRILDFNIQSHADKLGFILAQFEYNIIRYNRKSMNNSSHLVLAPTFKYPKLLAKLHPQASDYAINLKGLQALNITRNLFVNPELRFELVVAIIIDPRERAVNAVENYWGSIFPHEINERIFDFDDWNSYAVIEFSPYLTSDSLASASMIATEPRELHLSSIATPSSRPLGGRLIKSLTLSTRKEPYIIETDLTVMPNARLIIEKGVTLEFMPNVGILVLGELLAAGTRDKPIQMRPLLSSADLIPVHEYLFPPKPKPYLTQTNPNELSLHEHNYAFKHNQYAYPIDLGSIRLCKNEICNDGSHIYENNVEDPTLRQEILKSSNNTWKMDGFLEIFNMTTLQWVPVCDPLFTDHIARVVCRQLGFTHLTLFKRGRRYTIEQEQISSVKYWPVSIQCEGDEFSISNCPLVASGYTNHSTACSREGNQFVYIYCQDFTESGNPFVTHSQKISNEHAHHWGGIQFACPSISANNIYDGRNAHTYMMQSPNATKSKLQYVTIDRAGMLHRKRSPAIQILQCNVHMEYVSVSNSAHHGIETITSNGFQNFHQLKIRNNLGIGLNYLSLTGSSSASRLIPYLPLKNLDISSDIFGIVDVCGANKEIIVEDRLLLFYRYTSQPVDCIKIISSNLRVKHLGIRMLQFNLFNSTSYTTRPDSIKIYDGNIFDPDSRMIVDLSVTEKHRIERPELKFYQSSDTTMTIRAHVSGSTSLYGFVAEIVTTPVSYNIQRDTFNNITFSEISNNKLGALTISSAGESSPNLVIKNNRIESNCLHLFGNFTSCTSAIFMELQNCQRLKVINNLIKGNQGAMMIKSYSHTAVSALDATIENNVIEDNHNTYILAFLGPKTDPYQTVRVTKNFITRNQAYYLPNIMLSRIVSNFSANIISGNIGKHQIEVVGFDRLPLSYQTFAHNWIYNNTATFERDRSTIFGNSAGQQYFMNYFVNPDNHFEISTMNWSRYDVKTFHIPKDDEIIHLTSGDGSTKDIFRKTADLIPINILDTKKLDLYHATINAKQNWWGFNSTSAIQGRIRDRIQHEELIKVDFSPFVETNRSVLSGFCSGGWQKVGQTCLVYVGSRMTYQEAKDFCDQERATLPLIRGNHYEYTDFVDSQDMDFDSRIDKVWIRSFEVSRDACPALNDYRIKKYDCQEKIAFICEKDTQIALSFVNWYRETGGIIAMVLSMVTLLLVSCCTLCWAYKSRQRYKERIQRKNTIYASMRSNRASYSSSNSLNDFYVHRHSYNPEKSSITDESLSTQLTQQSIYDHSPSIQHSSSNLRNIDTQKVLAKILKNPMPNHFNGQPTVKKKPKYNAHSTNQKRNQIDKDVHENFVPQETSRINFQPDYLATSSSISQADSFHAGSNMAEMLTDPMPPAEPVRLTYSQINHSLNTNRNFRLPSTFETQRQPVYFKPPTAPMYQNSMQPNEPNPPPPLNLPSPLNVPDDSLHSKNHYNFDNMNDNNTLITSEKFHHIDGSDSSAPTHYSNRVEAYEDSVKSFAETYENSINMSLQRMDDGQATFMLSERSSTTDLLINSSQLTHSSSNYESRPDLVGMKPLESLDYVMDSVSTNNIHSNKAYSETPSGSQYNNRYCVETSFDLDSPTQPMKASESMFDSSQRLSPASSYAPTDSKLGSRVYLETSFE